MWLEPLADGEFANLRRAPRVGFELMVRYRRGVTRSTAILKDMTTHGAKIEGLGRMELDEPITLLLPGERPCEAYVAWSKDHTAGLEFGDPLHQSVFDRLVADHAVGQQAGSELPRAA